MRYYANLIYNKIKYFINNEMINNARINISLIMLILISFVHEFYEIHIFNIFYTFYSIY